MAKLARRLRSLDFVAKVTGTFDPYDATSKGLKEFMRRVQGAKLKKTNDKCVVTVKLLECRSPSTILFEFADGNSKLIETSGLQHTDITEAMNDSVASLELESIREQAMKYAKENPGVVYDGYYEDMTSHYRFEEDFRTDEGEDASN